MARSFANPSPPPPTCDNLQGLVLIATEIPVNTRIFGDQIPEITTSTMTLCWCNLLTPDPFFESWAVLDGASRYDTDPPLMSTRTGCVQLNLHFISPTDQDALSINRPLGVPEPLQFGPGGGISVSFL